MKVLIKPDSAIQTTPPDNLLIDFSAFCGMKKVQIFFCAFSYAAFEQRKNFMFVSFSIYNLFDGKERSGDNIRSGFDFI